MVDAIVTEIYRRAYPRIVRRFPPYQRLYGEIADIVAAHQSAIGDRRARILDLAAGAGDLAFALADAGYEVVGIEPIGQLRRIAAQRAGHEPYSNLTFVAEPEAADDFDIVLSLHALYADLGWKDKLRFAFEALRPGGIAVIVNFAAPISTWRAVPAIARREGLRAAAGSLLWLLPNATFNQFRRPRTPAFWPQDVLEARVRNAGFAIADIHRTFLTDVSALILARKPHD